MISFLFFLKGVSARVHETRTPSEPNENEIKPFTRNVRNNPFYKKRQWRKP